MIQRYVIHNTSATVTVDGQKLGPATAVGWCTDEDVTELEAKYAKLNKHCLALFYAVCELTRQDMTTEERVEALQQATEAMCRYADDPDFGT
jgi:hypothetical protein